MDFRRILLALNESGVEYVVVGGVSAVLQGVPATTFDLDIVPSRSEQNRTRLLRVLQGLEACYREHLPAKRLVPTADDLASDGHLLLVTTSGPLDVLGTVVGGLDYDDLVARSHTLEVGEGTNVQVLDLAAIIEMKERMGREKDVAQLPLLRRALRERDES